MLRHACGFKLANDGVDISALNLRGRPILSGTTSWSDMAVMSAPTYSLATSITPSDHLHKRRIRAPISTDWTFDDLAIATVVASGQTQTSNRSTIESDIKRVRAVYMWRSPLLFC